MQNNFTVTINMQFNNNLLIHNITTNGRPNWSQAVLGTYNQNGNNQLRHIIPWSLMVKALSATAGRNTQANVLQFFQQGWNYNTNNLQTYCEQLLTSAGYGTTINTWPGNGTANQGLGGTMAANTRWNQGTNNVFLSQYAKRNRQRAFTTTGLPGSQVPLFNNNTTGTQGGNLNVGASSSRYRNAIHSANEFDAPNCTQNVNSANMILKDLRKIYSALVYIKNGSTLGMNENPTYWLNKLISEDFGFRFSTNNQGWLRYM